LGLGADEASSGVLEAAEGSGAAAASGEAAPAVRMLPVGLGAASKAAEALGGGSALDGGSALGAAASDASAVLLAAGLRRRRRPLPVRAGSAGAWPLSVSAPLTSAFAVPVREAESAAVP
jgi:hypothetical protein